MQQDRIQQIVNAFAGLRRHLDKLRIATPFLRNHILGTQLAGDALRIGTLFVNFIDRHHDGYTRRTRVLNRLFSLRHNAVVCRNHQDYHVSTLSPAGSHGGKGGVSRGIQKGDCALGRVYMVGANVLRDSAGFSRGDTGFSNIVEQ